MNSLPRRTEPPKVLPQVNFNLQQHVEAVPIQYSHDFFLETHSRSKLLKVERNSTNGIWSPPAKSLAKWAIVSAGSPSLVSSVACFKVLPSLTYWAIVAKHSISLSCCASSAGGQALGTSDKCRTGVRA